jgi:hypothetical protein
MTTQRPTFTQRGGDGAGFFYLLASGGATGSINFDFTTGSLPAGITFTRASIGTYNSSGNLLVTAGNDVARFNYVGGVANLLIEPSATNLYPQSNNFSAAPWTTGNGAVITAAQFISPDGANNGWSFTSGTANGQLLQTLPTSNIPYTLSVWVKLITGVSNTGFVISSTTVTKTPTSTLTRLSGTATPPALGSTTIYFMILSGSGIVDGIYGAQFETGSVMTSYIPTTTTAVTRAADSAVFTIPSGVGHLTYTFDDNSTQLVTVSAGSYTIPTTLSRPNIKSIVGSA